MTMSMNPPTVLTKRERVYLIVAVTVGTLVVAGAMVGILLVLSIIVGGMLRML